MSVCVCLPLGGHALSGRGFITQDILTQTRPRSALRQVPEDALSCTRYLSTCMGQVCFFVSKKESSDVSILPWKMEAGEDLPQEAGGQGYAEEGSATH